ncbi:MAG: NAD(P)/FAD-dependent oxidoreductase [Prevotellaceae bacterium]|jgi:predicted Rossmann fold flavoprotein|nr:NAD(P)/FAD-dependent oxidoreductase [Prevotellaceae bacterium]
MQAVDLVVAGGGPAGILAAGHAAMQGKHVLLVEKMEKPLRKLRISGKGRCNITSTKSVEEFLHKVNPLGDFLLPSFQEFYNKDIVSLINEMGVPTVVERGDRVFPASQKAWDVAEALVKWAKRNGVDIQCHTKVTRIISKDKAIQAVELESKGRRATVSCKAIILATGGASYPATGSTGDGYRLSKQLGHTIVNIRPSVVPLEISEALRHRVQGLALRNVAVAVVDAATNQQLDGEFGELIFTTFGVAGPTILRVSHAAVDAFLADKNVDIQLDLKPALNELKLKNRLQRELENPDVNSVQALLRKLMPAGFIPLFMSVAGIRSQEQISEQLQGKIISTLKKLTLHMSGYRPFTEAIVTAGGVNLAEVDERTMQSKKVEGLYFAGELLDLDAATGGYNMQIAFSTGWLAGSLKS